jgi:hypothetical protein
LACTKLRVCRWALRFSFVIVLVWPGLRLLAQQGAADALPDAPGFETQAAPANPATGDGTISGTVVDTNGGVVLGADVTLAATGKKATFAQKSGNDGQFTFSGLSAGVYVVTATAPGMGSAQSTKITLSDGETKYLPQLVLPVVGSTTVRVTANQEQIATEDVHLEESQRILGVFPNFYSSFDWNAPPLNSKLKFHLALRSLIDPTVFLEAGAIAGGEQIQGLYPGFGKGAEGYGKRYAAAYANTFDSRILGEALFPSIFRQDPRYFYKGTGSITSRATYAAEQGVMCRGDNGHQQFCYSHVLAYFAAGAISNLYYPKGNRGAGLVAENGLIEIGGAAAANLLREFVWPAFTTHAPHSMIGKH